MKRFYEAAAAVASEGGWAVELDSRPLRTPGKAALLLPSRALAEAIADEWQTVADEIYPAVMRMTGMANAAIDRIAPDPRGFAQGIAAYAESDLFCYRAAAPQALAERQAAAWNPPLAWVERHYSVEFVLAEGVMPVDQPAATIARLADAVLALPPFALAPMSLLTTIGGSLVAALALSEGAFAPDALWQALILDELWEEEQWGGDALALAARANRREDWMAAATFLGLATA